MTDKPFDVCGIGNAIVDVLAHCDLDFIERMKLNKGTMTLIDTARAEELYAAIASVLAFVYSLKRGEQPRMPQVEIPVALRFDADGRAAA